MRRSGSLTLAQRRVLHAIEVCRTASWPCTTAWSTSAGATTRTATAPRRCTSPLPSCSGASCSKSCPQASRASDTSGAARIGSAPVAWRAAEPCSRSLRLRDLRRPAKPPSTPFAASSESTSPSVPSATRELFASWHASPPAPLLPPSSIRRDAAPSPPSHLASHDGSSASRTCSPDRRRAPLPGPRTDPSPHRNAQPLPFTPSQRPVPSPKRRIESPSSRRGGAAAQFKLLGVQAIGLLSPRPSVDLDAGGVDDAVLDVVGVQEAV